jgi:hypothetical protein
LNPDPLAQLRGYHLPEPVSWWPPAPGWWLLAVLLPAVIGTAAWLFLVYRRRVAARRSARRELQALRSAHAAGSDDAALARGLSRLLRRFALARFPRERVAGLTGEAWLRFLDRYATDRAFTAGAGRALVEAPYRPDAPLPATELTNLVEQWIRRTPKIEP